MTERDRLRGTGGNRFIGPDATRGDLLKSINDQLGDLQEWADQTGRVFDLAEVTISTERIPSGWISVSVTADLADDSARPIPPAAPRCYCDQIESRLVVCPVHPEAHIIPPAEKGEAGA